VRGRKQFQECLDKFSQTQFDNTKKRINSMIKGNVSGIPPPYLFGQQGLANAMESAQTLTVQANELLNLVYEEYEIRRRELALVGGGTIAACWKEIDSQFDGLKKALERILGSEETRNEPD
jgi:hypothetical protein